MESTINNIYYYQPNLPKVDTSSVFDISKEGDDLRVKNQNVNCLFRNLSAEIFDKEYNNCYRHLNLNFSPLNIHNESYFLNEKEQNKLVQEAITSWIYFYAVNNLPVKVSKDDFDGPGLMDQLLSILDKKYGIDTPISLSLGARILRQNPEKYEERVKGRRMYYEK
jgi:hypothetical protein